MTQLCATTLDQSGVPIPHYDRQILAPGIVHFGLSNFARAHLARYAHALLESGFEPMWGICGIGTTHFDVRLRDALHMQDNLYSLTEKHRDGRVNSQIIGSVTDYLLVHEDEKRIIELLCSPATRIVSLTITEGAYAISSDNQAGRRVFEIIVAALRRRMENGAEAFTIMSCDNIQSNGEVARAAVLEVAADEPLLQAWIACKVAFPNSMVDRITPKTTTQDEQVAAGAVGLEDSAPVVCEPFSQWVLEDRFSNGRPPFEQCDVQLVNDVIPYELMKIRLLNCSHQAIAYTGALFGYQYAHEAISDSTLAEFVRRYMSEAVASLSPVPGIDLDEYRETLISRFGNAQIKDTLGRLCEDTSSRSGQWILPLIEENLDAGRSVRWSTWIIASWARYAEGIDERGGTFDVVDPLAAELLPLAARNSEDPRAFLEHPLFDRLRSRPEFVDEFQTALVAIREVGCASALRQALAHSQTRPL